MTSKEALDKLYMACDSNLLYEQCGILFPTTLTDIIEQDLERFKLIEEDYYSLNKEYEWIEFENVKLKQENKELLVNKNVAQGIAIKYKKALDIFKSKIELPLEDDFDVINKDNVHLYHLRVKALVNEEEYNLLKEVLEND